MATTIELSQQTTLPTNKVRSAVSDVFDELKTKYTLTGSWESDSLFIISGEGFVGRLEVLQDGVSLSLSLSGMLSLFSGMIESQLKDTLADKLSG